MCLNKHFNVKKIIIEFLRSRFVGSKLKFLFEVKNKQDCSYQGEALNVPTAF